MPRESQFLAKCGGKCSCRFGKCVVSTRHGIGQVGGKPSDFADNIMQSWFDHRQGGTSEDAVAFYPRLIEKLLATFRGRNVGDPSGDSFREIQNYTYGIHSGNLYIATPTAWLTWLKHVAERDLTLPTKSGCKRKSRPGERL